MIKPDWPAADKRLHIGKRVDRIDGPAKSTGTAKYSYDINRPGMLWAKLVTSPYPKAKLEEIDTTAASALPGVSAVWKDDDLIGKEVQYTGQIVAACRLPTSAIPLSTFHLPAHPFLKARRLFAEFCAMHQLRIVCPVERRPPLRPLPRRRHPRQQRPHFAQFDLRLRDPLRQIRDGKLRRAGAGDPE